MPELPEVETVKRGLEKLIIGKTIVSETHDWPKGFPNSQSDVARFLVGSKVVSVQRRAKVLFINLSSGYTLLIHLKMTGQLVFVGAERFGAGHPNDSLVGSLPDTSTRVTFYFSDGSQLFFNDQRKFGWVKLVPTVEIQGIDFIKRLGPEPLEANFTSERFIERLKNRKNSMIKAVLLDQSVLAGVGNIYADESLFAAKIHPETRVKYLRSASLTTLYEELEKVLKVAIAKGGSSDRNYVNAEGKKGSYIAFAKVFRKEGTPCLDCGVTIEKIKVAGRGTHICPSCQVRPA